MLQHVRAEQVAFAGLIQWRAHGQVEDHQSGIELDGVAAGIRLPRRQSVAPWPGQDRKKPPEKDESADEKRLIVPVGPVDHGNLAIDATEGMATKSAKLDSD